MKAKIVIAWIVILLIGLIPVFMLFAFGYKTSAPVTYTIGRVAGLMGMTFFALTFILSTRAKWIEDIFDGQDKVYPLHEILGGTSLILLLIHPLLLVMKYIPNNIQAAAKYLLPGGFLSVDIGQYALLGLILLLAITLYINLRYHTWKFTHEFLGVIFILAVIHILLVRTDVAIDPVFKGFTEYAILVSAIGLGGYAYSLLRVRIKGRDYKIERIANNNHCTELILKPLDKGISYKAGQFVFVKFQNKQVGKESHPFSLASASNDEHLRIIAKNLGDFTNQMMHLRKGDHVIVEGPYGRFHKDEYADEIWIAGGIGITPFLGLAQDVSDNTDAKIDLYYSVSNKDEFIHLDELQELAYKNKNFRFFPWITSENGYLTLNHVAKHSKLLDKSFYLCGPTGMKEAFKQALHKKNIPVIRIHDERFAFK